MAKKRKRVIRRSAAYGSFDIDKFIFTDCRISKRYYYCRLIGGSIVKAYKLDKIRKIAFKNVGRLIENENFKPSMQATGGVTGSHSSTPVVMRKYGEIQARSVHARVISAKQIVAATHKVLTYLGDLISPGDEIAINTETFVITKLK